MPTTAFLSLPTHHFVWGAVSKGTSANLLKISSKRRRPKEQIQEEKKQEALHKLEVEQKLQQYDAM